MNTPLMPCSAAHLIERGLVSGYQICGCGFCSGCGLEPQLLGKDALADLVHQDFLSGGMHLRQGAVAHRDPVFGHDHRKARRAIVEYADL